MDEVDACFSRYVGKGDSRHLVNLDYPVDDITDFFLNHHFNFRLRTEQNIDYTDGNSQAGKSH